MLLNPLWWSAPADVALIKDTCTMTFYIQRIYQNRIHHNSTTVVTQYLHEYRIKRVITRATRVTDEHATAGHPDAKRFYRTRR